MEMIIQFTIMVKKIETKFRLVMLKRKQTKNCIKKCSQ